MEEIVQLIFNNIEENSDYKKLINSVMLKCFEEEQIASDKLYISVTLTNNEEIHKINKEFRNIDRSTDVLSFPMFEKEELEKIIKEEQKHKEVLGDIIISIPKVKEQAEEYGHSFERELAYMLVHGFYHLMGYDHIEEQDKKIMRKKEENVLNKLNINR